MNVITYQMSLMDYLFNHSIMLGRIIGLLYECTLAGSFILNRHILLLGKSTNLCCFKHFDVT